MSTRCRTYAMQHAPVGSRLQRAHGQGTGRVLSATASSGHDAGSVCSPHSSPTPSRKQFRPPRDLQVPRCCDQDEGCPPRRPAGALHLSYAGAAPVSSVGSGGGGDGALWVGHARGLHDSTPLLLKSAPATRSGVQKPAALAWRRAVPAAGQQRGTAAAASVHAFGRLVAASLPASACI